MLLTTWREWPVEPEGVAAKPRLNGFLLILAGTMQRFKNNQANKLKFSKDITLLADFLPLSVFLLGLVFSLFPGRGLVLMV